MPRALGARRGPGACAVALAAITLLAAGCTGTAPAAAPPAAAAPAPAPPPGDAPGGLVDPVRTPVVGSVLYAPVPFLGEDGRTHLVYELMVTNATPAAATLDKLDVLDEATGTPVLTLSGADLGGRVRIMGQDAYAPTLGAGQAGTVFVHVVLAAGAAAPKALTHALTLSSTILPPQANPFVQRLAPTSVDERTLPVLGPPLRGAGYLAADGCCDAVRHTRAVLALNGGAYLAQRYAIDYEQVGPDDKIYVGDKANVNSYRIFGKEALAVADATVVATHDGLSEQVPGVVPPDIPITEADGNFVVLDLGNGFYANYAHLQPKSLRVQRGAQVRKGDVLGLVGNTGRSFAPHLHFHVMDASSPVVSQGLPYLIDSFTVTGRGASTAEFDRAEADGVPLATVPGLTPTEHRDQMVLDQSLVTFGGS